jgi:glucose-6-phosphate dehydrogenase assembly protein OpcA
MDGSGDGRDAREHLGFCLAPAILPALHGENDAGRIAGATQKQCPPKVSMTADELVSGEDVKVDSASIEQTLAELWRGEKRDDNEHAVTRAALWNVVAHSATAEHHTHASETLSKASIAVPQRTIVVRADPAAPPEMTSWISANCHLLGEGKQVCSEEIAIVAGGDRVPRVPPLVSALLIPDMPVAVWWLGDLPHENAAYVDALLEPADRLIVDSCEFDSPADLAIVARVAQKTLTAPADLNWIRLEEWRVATASLFDPPPMRTKLRDVRKVRVLTDSMQQNYFGERIEGLLFASWVLAQAGCEIERVEIEIEQRQALRRGLLRVDVTMDDGFSATIERDMERGILVTRYDGLVMVPEGVTRARKRSTDELIVRELKDPASDRLLLKVLPVAVELAKRVA